MIVQNPRNLSKIGALYHSFLFSLFSFPSCEIIHSKPTTPVPVVRTGVRESHIQERAARAGARTHAFTNILCPQIHRWVQTTQHRHNFGHSSREYTSCPPTVDFSRSSASLAVARWPPASFAAASRAVLSCAAAFWSSASRAAAFRAAAASCFALSAWRACRGARVEE